MSTHVTFDWRWGNNRLTCCPECGPIRERYDPAFPLRRLPEDSCGMTFPAVAIYLLFQVAPPPLPHPNPNPNPGPSPSLLFQVRPAPSPSPHPEPGPKPAPAPEPPHP